MAILHLRLTPLSRANGINAIEVAARYAAVLLIDQRSGTIFDFSEATGVLCRQILGPDDAGTWWQDRQSLWNAAELREVRRDARVAREYQLGLPYEISDTQRLELAQRWAGFVIQRYGHGVDLTVHAPPEAGDSRNHYAKLLATTRRVTAAGFGEKTAIEQTNPGYSGPKELRLLHQQWEQMVAEALCLAQDPVPMN